MKCRAALLALLGLACTSWRGYPEGFTCGQGSACPQGQLCDSVAGVCRVPTGGRLTCGASLCGEGLACLGGVCSCIAQVSMGTSAVCLRRSGGATECWGNDSSGQLSVAALPDVREVAVGGAHACARVADGKIRCSGLNTSGECGTGAVSSSAVANPATVVGLPAGATAEQLALGVAHSCALVGGEVWCWGSNRYGQLGRAGSESCLACTGACASTAGKVDALPGGVIAIAAGGHHTCALLADRSVYCWGLNRAGQLGDGTQQNRPSPVVVTQAAGSSEIVAGVEHTCIRKDAALLCWGRNSSEQLGLGVHSSSDCTFAQGMCDALGGGAGCSTSPSPVGHATLFEAAQVSAAYFHTCARSTTGALFCWGNRQSGQLGEGTTGGGSTTTFDPVPVSKASGLVRAGAVWTGGYNTCALGLEGDLWCWGRNQHGEVRNVSGENQALPIKQGICP